MKLKEKLAQDFLMVDHWNDKMDGAQLDESQEIYLAGFEKGREMAMQTMSDTPHAYFRLKDLGEEEVEDGTV